MTTPASARWHRLLPIALAQGVGLACGVLGVSLTSRWVPPEVWGKYSLFLTLVPIGIWVFFAGILKGIARQWAGSPQRASLAWHALGVGTRKLPWMVLAIVGLAAGLFEQAWPFYALVTVVAACLLGATTFAQTTLQATQAHWRDFTASAFGSLTRTFLPLGLFVLTAAAPWSLAGGFLAHAGLTALLALWLAYRPTESSPGQTDVLAPTYQGPLFLLLALAHWTVSGLNRWTAALFLGDEVTGHVALAGSIAMLPTSMLGTILLQYFQPGLYALPHGTPEERQTIARRIDRIAALYTGLSVLGLVALHYLLPHLVGVWIDAKYAACLEWVIPLGAFTVMILLGQILQTGLLAARREDRCGPIEITCGVVVVAVTLAAAKFGGASGFKVWLLISPLVPWGLYRTWARRVLLEPASTP